MYYRALMAIAVVALLCGADWTRFRGTDGAGVSADKGLPVTWSAEENIVWKTPLPGFGSSSPITLGDRIFLTTYTGYGFDHENPGEQENLAQHVLCIDRATGKIVWNRDVAVKLPETPYDAGRIELHGYASSTPVTDGESLFVFFGKTGVLKYSLDGELLWQVSVGTEVDKHNWGSAASPILHKDLVIVNASAESKSIRALRKTTGEEVWRVDGIVDSWSTPLVVTSADGREDLVVVERFQILGLNPMTGEKLWYCDKPSDYICPSVIAHGEVVYAINSRFKAALFAIRVGGQGDVTDSHVLWTKDKWTTRVSTPVFHNGHLYAIDFAGIASCINTATGEEVYRERLRIGGGGDKIYASLVAADDKIFGVSRLDGTVVLALEPKFKLLSHNHLGDESVFNATPVVADGRLLLRSDKFLYCIGK
jgi:outer membrane protein assembly factor BamB